MEFKKISDADYNAMEGWRCTSFKNVQKFGLYDELNPPHRVEKDAFVFGSALHCAVLENERFDKDYGVGSKVNERIGNLVKLANAGLEMVVHTASKSNTTKKFKDEAESLDSSKEFLVLPDDKDAVISALENDKKIILTQTDMNSIKYMRENIMKKYGDLIEGSEREFVMTARIDDIQLKVKVDAFNPEFGVMIDLKSIGALNFKDIVWDSAKFHYDLQVAFYQNVMNANGIDINQNGFLFSSKADFRSQLYISNDEFMASGQAKFNNVARQIVDYQETGNISGVTMTMITPDELKR